MQSLVNENLDSNENNFNTKHKLNPNQTHSPIVHQHVEKDAPGPYSFLQL
jgi:hypothetical protein